MLFAHRTPPTASLIYPVVLRVRGYSVDVLYRAADELGFHILYTPLYHLYRHLQPQTLIILKILGCPVFGGKEKGDSPKPAYAATSELWTKFTGLLASPLIPTKD